MFAQSENLPTELQQNALETAWNAAKTKAGQPVFTVHRLHPTITMLPTINNGVFAEDSESKELTYLDMSQLIPNITRYCVDIVQCSLRLSRTYDKSCTLEVLNLVFTVNPL